MIRNFRGNFARSIALSRRYFSLLDISPAAEEDAANLIIKESFITPTEQNLLMEEIELAVSRVKYSYDHWDDVSYCVSRAMIQWFNRQYMVIEKQRRLTGQLQTLLSLRN